MSETKKVWITKYWESSQHYGAPAIIPKQVYPHGNKGGVCAKLRDGCVTAVWTKNEYRHTEQEAIEHVIKLAKNRVESLQRKIDSITEKWLK